MPLDPKAQEFLALTESSGAAGVGDLSVAEARSMALERIELYRSPLVQLGSIETRVIPDPHNSIPARIYRPKVLGSLPVILFFHGGGWVICNLDTHDAVCRALSAAAKSLVISVDYRLAPECKFPAATDDCLAATRWAAEHAPEFGADPQRMALIGDSAGGNLAAVTALRLRDEGGPALRAQVLVYPVTQYYYPGTPSYFEFGEGYTLTRKAMIWFWDHYLESAEQAADPKAVPMKAQSLAGLPPALVITAKYDPLLDEGEQFAGRLRDANVETKLIAFDDMMHGFFSGVGYFRQADEAVQAVAGWLQEKLA